MPHPHVTGLPLTAAGFVELGFTKPGEGWGEVELGGDGVRRTCGQGGSSSSCPPPSAEGRVLFLEPASPVRGIPSGLREHAFADGSFLSKAQARSEK